MEAGSEHIRLKLLEEKDATHERTHGRMWDKINGNHTAIEVHKQHSEDVFERIEGNYTDLKEDVGTVQKRINWLIGLVLIAALGLIGNLGMMVVERS